MWAPIVVVAALGGVSMISRPRARRSRLQASEATKVLADPKVSKAVEAAQHALDEARQALVARDGHRIQEEFSRRAGSAVDSTRENLPTSMKDAGDLARELADRIRVEGQAKSVEIGQRLREEVAPKAKTYAQEAGTILSSARERANEMSKNARRDYGPDVSKKAAALGGLLAAGSSSGVQMLRQRAQEMNRTSKRSSKHGLKARGSQKASSALQAAGNQAKYLATESLMTAFWASLLGATIYFAILTREQRERVKGFCSSMFAQVQDVVSDFSTSGEEINRSTR